MSTAPVLAIQDLHAWYGGAHVLQGVNLFVNPGEIVSLIGRNGAGKSTTMKSVMGLVPKITGKVRFNGIDVLAMPAHARFGLGLAYVPEERRIVPGLTVLENLRLGLLAAPLQEREADLIDAAIQIFPRLNERLRQTAVTLSGGEQQMLAIARALAAQPRMIMLDEPSQGIMPVLVDEMYELFTHLKQSNVTILLVEQDVERALSISDRVYVMDQDMVVHHDEVQHFLSDPSVHERYCAV